jgi:glutamyl-tRNA synthetase
MIKMNINKEIAQLLLPNITTETSFYEEKYKNRILPEGALVTRFAPSPTGFLHLGGVFAALISERLAHQSNGVFYLRIEDTDKKREVEGSIPEIVRGMNEYNIMFDEGVVDGYNEKGEYGPYKQSMREDIYKSYVKALIEQGLAYPCFCSPEELEEIRNIQEAEKVTPGYYGKWAKYRNITIDEIKQNLAAGKEFVIRLKSPGSEDNRVSFEDAIKGTIEMPENVQDVVILKSEGLPTYHFAHAIDDHLMKTTHVVRGEEWLSSTPIHLQLFKVLGFETPKYAHIPTLMKVEGNSKRKLSKRKDPELAFSYYSEQGYHPEAVIDYLFHIINSNYEEWRAENQKLSYREFMLQIDKMGTAGAVFDLVKLTDVSKNFIANLTAEEVCNFYISWAEKYDAEMADLMKGNKSYANAVFNIERETENKRKDIAKWTDVREYAFFFYDDLYKNDTRNLEFPSNLSKDDLVEILSKYREEYKPYQNNSEWFDALKAFAEGLGYAKNAKLYKKNTELYKGHIGDVAMTLRLALTKKPNTPDLFEIMNLLGVDKVKERLSNVEASLN